MPIQEALAIAADRNLDLVEVAPSARPPVCRLMDYGKFKFQQNKKERDVKKKQKIIDVKEVKLRPSIDEHDFLVKAKNARRFLSVGDKVKVSIMFRGREITHPQLGQDLCAKFAEELQDVSTIEKQPKVEGRNMIMVLVPRKDKDKDIDE